jgi:hypothetical protein
MARKQTDISPAWEEFAELCEEFGGEEFTAKMQRRLGLEGLAEVRYQARRGSLDAAKTLLVHWVGQPALPIDMRTQAMMSPDEVRAAMLQLYRDQGFTEEEAAARVAELEPEETNG